MSAPQTARKSAQPVQAAPVDRLETIIHAAWRVVAQGGLSALTIRSIAAELGLTTGVVMHYFSTKEAILEEMIDRLYGRLRKVTQASVADLDASLRLERLLLAGLPLTKDTEFGWKLAVALQPEALRSPAIAVLHQRHHAAIEIALEDELNALAAAGRLRADVDRRLAAMRLMALVEGLGTHAVLRPSAMTPQLVRQLLQEELDSLLTAERNLKKSRQNRTKRA
jgi:TetR/AcrR family transcriptional regulator, transcriptional repressor of aconitase